MVRWLFKMVDSVIQKQYSDFYSKNKDHDISSKSEFDSYFDNYDPNSGNHNNVKNLSRELESILFSQFLRSTSAYDDSIYSSFLIEEYSKSVSRNLGIADKLEYQINRNSK